MSVRLPARKPLPSFSPPDTTEAFSKLQSHYLFAAKFGRPGTGNDRETWKDWWAMRGGTSWCRCRAWLVGRSSTRTCASSAGSVASGSCGDTPKPLLSDSSATREKLLPLPPAPLEACEQRTMRVSSQALVRYETNNYSVPAEYGHRQVLVKAFLWEVAISAASEVIARHSRSYGREEMIFNPLHCLALLERKTSALDQAAPLQTWQLPQELIELRRQMETRLRNHGRREFVQVLRLLETFSMAEVSAAAREALRIPAVSFDAVKHCCCARSSAGFRSWVWKTIRICRPQKWR